MKKFTVLPVETAAGQKFAAYDSRGKQIGTRVFDLEWECNLAAVHWACAPSLSKRLNLRKVDGVLTGRPFSGVKVHSVHKQTSGEWRAVVKVDGQMVQYVADTMKQVLQMIDRLGDDIKTTRNILNPESKEINIERRAWGGCTDPGTETYHSM